MSPSNSAARLSVIHFVLLGVAWGLFGGLVEGVVRMWLQDAGATSFDMRLTGISARLLWVAPLSYAALFAPLGLLFAAAQRLLPRFDWSRLSMLAFGALAWLGALASSGRIAAISILVLALGLSSTANRLIPVGVRRRELVWRAAVAMFALVAVVVAGVEYGTRWQEHRATAALPAARQGAPNVLLVIVDTLRADRVATYGYAKGSTPTLTKLAQQGVQFDWAMAASSWSLPSHVSMLTGHLPTAHGAEIDLYDNRFPTLAQIFAGLGYRTAAISANTLVFSQAQGFAPGFLRFDDSFYTLVDGFTRTIVGRKLHKALYAALGWTHIPVKRTAADVTQRAIEWAEASPERPYFMVLNYFDIHDPDGHPASTTGGPYDDAVADVDRALGRLIAHIDAGDAAGNTVVVVTSDHGESLGQHGFPGHGSSLYIEQLHVPLIVRYPPRVPAGVRVSRAVSHINLANTILDLAGGTSATPVPGLSLAALWRQDGLAPAAWPMPRSELRYRPWQHTLQGQDLLRSLVDLPYHYVAHSLAGDELFNLKDDPNELKNLASEREAKPVLERFKHAVAEPGDHDAVESGSEQ